MEYGPCVTSDVIDLQTKDSWNLDSLLIQLMDCIILFSTVWIYRLMSPPNAAWTKIWRDFVDLTKYLYNSQYNKAFTRYGDKDLQHYLAKAYKKK